MPARRISRTLAVSAVLALLLSACAPAAREDESGGALTRVTWAGYDSFWSLLAETEPDIEVEFIPYAGANYTGCSWAQMRSGDDRLCRDLQGRREPDERDHRQAV